MGRIRTIKPEFFKHEELYDAEQETGLPLRLAFAGLWTCCDREGRFYWRPRALKTDILPYDEVDFPRVLHALATRGFIVKYASGGKEYGSVTAFSKHQVVNHRESASKIPPPPQPIDNDDELTREPRVNHASATRQHLAPGEGKGREGEREREEYGGGGSACVREAVPDPKFPQQDPADREQILAAMGVGPDGVVGPSKFIGGQGDMAEARRWLELPGLTLPAVLDELRRITAGKPDGPASSFKYFTPAMQRLSGQLTAPQLDPIQGERNDRRKPSSAQVDRAILDAAANLPHDYFSNPKYSDF